MLKDKIKCTNAKSKDTINKIKIVEAVKVALVWCRRSVGLMMSMERE